MSKLLLLPVQRHTHNILLFHAEGQRRRRSQAARSSWFRHGSGDDRRLRCFPPTLAATVSVPDVLDHLDLRRDDLQFLAHFGAHGVQGAVAARTDLLFSRQVVLDDFHGQILQLRLTLPVAFRRL